VRAGRPQVAADGRNPHLGLPDPVLKNMGPPIKYGFQTNEGYFFYYDRGDLLTQLDHVQLQGKLLDFGFLHLFPRARTGLL
jgi:hypothetical protein